MEMVKITRPVEAIEIPFGTKVMLPAGAEVRITQSLGGTYTVMTDDGYMARIADKDADALGKKSKGLPLATAATEKIGTVNEEMVWEQLKQVYDPEIPVNVVDLGLIYDLQIHPSPDGGSNVLVQMTLTAQGCGMGPSIARDAQHRIETLPGVAEAEVQVVWDPPWTPEMMSPAGKKQLGVE